MGLAKYLRRTQEESLGHFAGFILGVHRENHVRAQLIPPRLGRGMANKNKRMGSLK
jgi:hypothetical protein